MIDYKQLCAELLDWIRLLIEIPNPPVTRCADDLTDLIARTRAALAEPEPEGPTDEELLELTDDWPATTGPRHDLSGCPEVPLYSVFADEVIEFARAVLARWGQSDGPAVSDDREPASVAFEPSAAATADGEVAELVRKLREQAAAYSAYPGHAPLIEEWAQCFTRAANLLERLAPQPVPVSERLPGAEDCLDEGWAWFFNPRVGWRQATQPVHSTYTHWLPAYALPLPRTSGGDYDR